MTGMYFCPPQEMWTLLATTTGTVAADYLPAWLTDGRAKRPVRGPSGSPTALSLSLSGPSSEVGIVAVSHHNLIVPVTISGGVSATITPAATRPPNGIPLGAFALVTPTNVTALAFTVSGNDQTAVVGEFIAGKRNEVTPIRIEDLALSHDDFGIPPTGLQSVPNVDQGQEQRTLSGTQIYNTADRDKLLGFWQGQRGASLPSLVVPDPDLNDPWLAYFKGFTYRSLSTADGECWLVSMQFIEYPRVRW